MSVWFHSFLLLFVNGNIALQYIVDAVANTMDEFLPSFIYYPVTCLFIGFEIINIIQFARKHLHYVSHNWRMKVYEKCTYSIFVQAFISIQAGSPLEHKLVPRRNSTWFLDIKCGGVTPSMRRSTAVDAEEEEELFHQCGGGGGGVTPSMRGRRRRSYSVNAEEEEELLRQCGGGGGVTSSMRRRRRRRSYSVDAEEEEGGGVTPSMRRRRRSYSVNAEELLRTHAWATKPRAMHARMSHARTHEPRTHAAYRPGKLI